MDQNNPNTMCEQYNLNVLKALEIGNSQQKKSVFYFDRVFDDTCTQDTVKSFESFILTDHA